MRQTTSRGERIRRAAITTALAMTLTAAAGIGAGRSLAHIGGPPQLVHTRNVSGGLLVVVLLAFVSALVLISVAFAVTRRRDAETDPERVVEQPSEPRWLLLLVIAAPVAATGGLGTAAFLTVNWGSGGPSRTDSSPTAPVGSGGVNWPPEPIRPHVAHPGRSLITINWGVVGIVVAALILGALAVVVWRRRVLHENGRRRDEHVQGVPVVDDAVVQRVVVQSLDAVRAEPDPRRAVLRAYAIMESSLGASGVPRERAETALEYLGRTLRAPHLHGRSLRRLTALFERAKFSPHAIDQQMKQDAVGALERVAHDLGSGHR